MTSPFLAGDELSAEIRSVLSEPGVRAAVAFWGAASEGWVPSGGARLICNLSTGGTNPRAIRRLRERCEVKQNERLHAKVYVGADRAVVASANASANGMGLEGVEQAGWIEAGVVSRDVAPIAAWFEDQWSAARVISDEDLAAAEASWRQRQASRPTVSSFASFDVDRDGLPHVSWQERDPDWELDEDILADQSLAHLPNLRGRLDEGLVINEDEADATLAGRWVLFVYRKPDGTADRRTRPWFERAGEIRVAKVLRYEDEDDDDWRDVLVAPLAGVRGRQPFDPAEARFVSAFWRTLAEPPFGDLLGDDDMKAPWYANREPVARRFWRRLKDVYDAAGGAAVSPPIASRT